jgi:hypothetical protein
MSRAMPPCVRGIKMCVRGLNLSGDLRTLRATINYLADRYIDHPSRDTQERFYIPDDCPARLEPEEKEEKNGNERKPR